MVSEKVDAKLLEKIIGNGEIVIIDETVGEIPWILSAGIKVNAPIENIWEVIADFKNYNKWVPSCSSVDVTEWNERVVDLQYHLGFKFIFLPLTVDYTVRHFHHPPYRTDWVGMGGEIEKTYGWFENVKVEDEKTLFFYNVWAIPGSGLLKKLYQKYPFLDVGISISAGAVYARKLKDYVEKQRGVSSTEEYKPFTEEEEVKIMKELTKKGPVLSFHPEEKEKLMEISSWIKVDVPIEKAWNMITDFSSYKYFEQMLEQVKVLEKGTEKAKVEFKYDVRILVIAVRPHFVLEYELVKPHLIRWKCIEGDKYIPEGFWKLYPIDDKSTLIKYKSLYDAHQLGQLVSMVMGILPEGKLALNSYITQQTLRDIRDWIQLTDEKREKIIQEYEKKTKGKKWGM